MHTSRGRQLVVSGPDEMSCVPHRCGTGERLFLLHHFLTVAGGSRLDAGKVDARDRVLDRAHRCETRRGSPVNFIAVDCTTIGDAREAVDMLEAHAPVRRRGGRRPPMTSAAGHRRGGGGGARKEGGGKSPRRRENATKS
ncbi:hypothetical protein ACFU6F_28485, partial [Streptomyces sp. NPDC057460]